MTKLSVNINKLATLRNARGKNNPNIINWASKIESFGAHGITVHPRPDERHIRKTDVIDLKTAVTEDLEYLKFSGVDRIEMYTEDYAQDNTTVDEYKKLAQFATASGLELNAGHDLNLKNLAQFITHIPEVKEVSIGHALICEALEFGMKDTIEAYLKILNECKSKTDLKSTSNFKIKHSKEEKRA